jgi:hypothetical protein
MSPIAVDITIEKNQPVAQPQDIPAKPEAEFKSPLRLTKEQHDKLEDETLMRIHEIRKEIGLDPKNEVIQGSWMWLRKCHESYYQGDLSWRLAMGGIFPKSNFTLGSGLRHTRYMAARVQDDLLGTSPFMAALARTSEKEDLAKQVEEFIQVEIETSGIRNPLREAQKIALYRNECVVKIGYVSDSTPFIGEATVLVDVATGAPITTPEKAIFIYEDDDFVPHPELPGLMMLVNDPSFTIAQNIQPGIVEIPASQDMPARMAKYQYIADLPQALVKKDGVTCKALDYRSFLCPLRVESIHDADTVAHLYLETPSRLNQIYGGIDVSQQYFAWWNQPGQDKPKYEQGEQNNVASVIYQQCVVAEVFRRCDPDQTGEDKEIFIVVDLTNNKIIYYNYLANHMAKRPFEVVPGIERVPGRWYGRGIYGMLEDHLLYEDAELNRANFKNSKAATITFADQSAVQSWMNGENPQIGTDQIFWLNPNWNPENGKKPIWRENLYEDASQDIAMMNTMRQSADSLIGSVSAQTASQSDFNQSQTATGNQLVQQASDVITKATEQEHTDAINSILAQVVNIILERMDRKKLHFSKRTNQLATLNRNECRTLAKDVRLLLTRSKSTQLLNTSQQALVIGKDYWALKKADPLQAKALRTQYINEAKALEVEDADEMFPEITDEEIQAFLQAQQGGAAPAVSHSISANLSDFTPSERGQAVSQFGIQPASPEETDQVVARKTELKMREEANKAAIKHREKHAMPGLL